MSLTLSKDELADLTKRRYRKLQVRELQHMGVRFKLNTCGEIVVLRSDVERRSGEPRPGTKPDFSTFGVN